MIASKPIRVKKDVLKKLAVYKIENDCKTYSEAINKAIGDKNRD